MLESDLQQDACWKISKDSQQSDLSRSISAPSNSSKEQGDNFGISYGPSSFKPDFNSSESNVTLTSLKGFINNTTLTNIGPELLTTNPISTISEKVDLKREEIHHSDKDNLQSSLKRDYSNNDRLFNYLRDYSSPIAVLTCAVIVLIFNNSKYIFIKLKIHNYPTNSINIIQPINYTLQMSRNCDTS